MKPKQRPAFSLMKEGSRADLFLSRQLSSPYFTYRDLLSMLLPLILDQFFINFINILTTAMISSSSQESVSAVSLVSPLYMMIFAVFNAISAGGTVIVAQYKGRRDEEKIKISSGQVVLSSFLLSLIASIALIACAAPLIRSMFSAADPAVLLKATDYLIGVAISLIFLSIYMGGFSVFRGIGETRVCLHLTIIINLIHLGASVLFLNILKLDIFGTVLSLNLARFIGAAVSMWILLRKKSSFHLSLRHIFHLDFSILKSVMKIGLPFGLEQVFFNGGSMLVQTYVVLLGTVSVAANAISNSAVSILYSAGLAVATLAVTVVGQCIGAGDKKLARHYGSKMIWLGNVITVLSLVIFLPLMPLILKLYQAPPETLHTIYRLVIICAVPMPFFWSMSNVMPAVLRSAGDSLFGSVISLITMWVVRVGLGYLIALPLGLGVQGVWVCLGIEWAVRTVIFRLRFRSDVWLNKHPID